MIRSDRAFGREKRCMDISLYSTRSIVRHACIVFSQNTTLWLQPCNFSSMYRLSTIQGRYTHTHEHERQYCTEHLYKRTYMLCILHTELPGMTRWDHTRTQWRPTLCQSVSIFRTWALIQIAICHTLAGVYTDTGLKRARQFRSMRSMWHMTSTVVQVWTT